MYGTDPATRDLCIWLLGNAHPSADRSIAWDEPFPNLSDPNVLLVDLTTLTRPVLEKIGRKKLDQARPFIVDKVIYNGTVVVITHPYLQIVPGPAMDKSLSPLPHGSHLSDPLVCSNYQILPVHLATVDVPDGRTIVPDPGHTFSDYAANVRRFSFHIKRYSPWRNSDTSGSFPVTIELVEVEGEGIRDNSGHYLGLTLAAETVEHYPDTSASHGITGRLVFLPPPTEPIGDAIGRILSVFGKVAPHAETPPAWAERLSLGRADECKGRASKLRANKAKIQNEIDSLEREADKLLAHRRLLYSKGRELEDAVVQAFRALGFDDIEHMGGADEGDAAFGMGGGTRYSRGVVEIKGLDRGALMQHIFQCKKWASQRAIADGKASKGILVPNQHRLQPYPESSEIRTKIEPNQLEQAVMDDICIIPSCALFEAVGRVLDGEAPDRAKIAAMIAATKGVLRDVL